MEWHRKPDWWLQHAIDAHMRSEFSDRWAVQCWIDLLMWAAEEPLNWQIVDAAGTPEGWKMIDEDYQWPVYDEALGG